MSGCPAPAPSTASDAARTERAARIQLLAQMPALRTALRRALAPSGGSLSPEQPHLRSGPDANRPDAVVLDTSLPGMQGLGLLRQIAAGDPAVPVIVVAPDTAEGRGLRTEALRGGAAGFVLRPDTDRPLALKSAAEEILSFLGPRTSHARPAVTAERSGHARDRRREPASTPRLGASEPVPGGVNAAPSRPARMPSPPQVAVIASSTGGPQALIDLFRNLSPAALPVPVLVVQHMPAAFTPILADHLSRATQWRAVEAANDEPMTTQEIRIAPGGFHMVIAGTGAGRRLRLTTAPPVNFCRPSADVLFTSAAEAFGRNVLAVVLTGMGSDGAEGAKVIAAAGGTILAQDKKTSVVWGMPGAAVATGVVHKVISLEGMPKAIESAAKGVY